MDQELKYQYPLTSGLQHPGSDPTAVASLVPSETSGL